MRIVLKIGTSTLAHPTGLLNIRHVEHLCKVVSDLKNAGHEIILVSSGAIGMGVGKLQLPGRPADMPSKQAAAAVGQCELMYTYDKLFGEYNHTVAQILLTADDILDAQRRENFQNTLYRLLELEALPIINENDTVATKGRPAGSVLRHPRPVHRRPERRPQCHPHPSGGGADAGDSCVGGDKRLRAGHRRDGD